MIEKTHHAQNPVNVAILNYVAERSQASYAELFAAFADLQTSEVKAHARFSKKMEYLCFTQQLCSRGRGHDRVFSLGAQAGKSSAATRWNTRPHAPKAAPERTAADARDAPAFALSPSRLTVTVLPTRSPALRPGALDFKSVASRGFAC
ncbi:hypothetical protein LHU53_15640 [Rhodoferax sp. U2-2l]|uniref:hypothetical protein n=1 Tax=Rhodoferax sp. U2-2l TaxID=2884000 RepID=UPI001D0A336C|nr:hypothetical protein [Rhodoferax sp. U2-2l]MCB8748333.1 hypothetical protein [Rhodoferax sp. U2-2l]